MIWTDEKLFTVQATHNHQNDWIYAVNKEVIPLYKRIAHKRQNPASVMVWAGVTSTGGKTPLTFIEDGVRINQHVYLNMLKEQLVPCIDAIIKKYGNTLQHDVATSHTANLVQEWWTERLWPPSSPDLSPMDVAVWSILESNAWS